MSTPTIGRIVHYRLSDQDAALIAVDRENSMDGYNVARGGDVYPAMIIRTFGGSACNLRVFLDGEDTYWATSRTCGDDPGRWVWPQREA